MLNLLTVKDCQAETSSNSSFPVAEVLKVSLLTDQQLLTPSWIHVLLRPEGPGQGSDLFPASQWSKGKNAAIKTDGPVQVIQQRNTSAHLTRSW